MFLAEGLSPFVKNLILLKGSLGQKQRQPIAEKIDGAQKTRKD
jgi:hypothetical protein